MHTSVYDQLRRIQEGMELRPDQINTANLLPIFVPTSFFSLGNWPGPYVRLRTPDIGLTWTILFDNQTMRYVSFDMKQYWEERQLDWKALAMRNLADQTRDTPGLHEMRRLTGELSAIALMFEDGLGPSRLLFRGTLGEKFPAGYRVAIPEMSCGLAYANNLPEAELAVVQGVIDGCYQKGTRPLTPSSYDADDLLPLEEFG